MAWQVPLNLSAILLPSPACPRFLCISILVLLSLKLLCGQGRVAPNQLGKQFGDLSPQGCAHVSTLFVKCLPFRDEASQFVLLTVLSANNHPVRLTSGLHSIHVNASPNSQRQGNGSQVTHPAHVVRKHREGHIAATPVKLAVS